VDIDNNRILQKYAKPSTLGLNEVEVPLSFNDWYLSRYGIIPGSEYKQYNEYLIDWYNKKRNTSTSSREKIKQNYFLLLKQLQIFYDDEDIESWYNNLNLNNELDLLRAIPFFAKKLKEISLYYLQLRKDIQSSRFVYNQLGTNNGLVQLLKQIILTNFTKQSKNILLLPSRIRRTLPELSSVNNSINVELDEIYDLTPYYDRSPTLSVSNYFNTETPLLQNYLTNKNLQLSSADWLYKLGAYSLSTTFDTIFNIQNSIEDFELAFNELYLGETITQFISSNTVTFSSQKDFYTVNIGQGNNFFYWPNGGYKSNIFTIPTYQPIALTALNIETLGVAGTAIQNSDTIFIKTARGTQGAWLRNVPFENEEQTVRAILDSNTKTIFRFPYPGYGLSGTDLPWTRFSLSSDPRFLYLDDEMRKAVETAYWSAPISATLVPILINDTTLADCSACASTKYNESDKIKTTNILIPYNDTNFINDFNEAWLYRFEKTDISVKANGGSVIYWPYEQINPEEDFPNYFPTDASDVCNSLPISSINLPFSTAGSTLSTADVIYKISNYADDPSLAVACSWLSGSTKTIFIQNNTNSLNVSANIVVQPSLNLTVKPNSYASFIWFGEETFADNVFKSLNHEKDCSFALKRNATYKDKDLCTCKQTMFTPFGHPGANFDRNNQFADFIIEVPDFTEQPALDSWLDRQNETYKESANFGWFKTNKKIGWGDGTWYSPGAASNRFRLKPNRCYYYYRVNTRTDKSPFPEYVVRYSYNNYFSEYNTSWCWMKGIKNQNGDWVGTNRRSTMIVQPGDLLIYQRRNNITASVVTSSVFFRSITERRNSAWSSLDYFTPGPLYIFEDGKPYSSSPTNTTVTVSYPLYNSNDSLNSSQLPKLQTNRFVGVSAWTVTQPDLTKLYFYDTSIFTFEPKQVGLYQISVAAISSVPGNNRVPTNSNVDSILQSVLSSIVVQSGTPAPTGLYYFNNIPLLTCVPLSSRKLNTEEITLGDIPGFVINTPLSGWIYDTKAAKPVWGKTFNNKDENTKFKRINNEGTAFRILNDHNIITQPPFSDIFLNEGDYFEYNRNIKSDIVWSQPISRNIPVNKKIWSLIELSANQVSNLSSVLNNINTNTVAIPTTRISPIILENFVDNEPVEVYYNALDNFIWNITASPINDIFVGTSLTSTNTFNPRYPWINVLNQNYPTIATIPSFDRLYPANILGGFFTPNNLGITTYVNKETTFQLNISALNDIPYFSSPHKLNSRGLSKTDQINPYIINTENSAWLKEPVTSNSIAGTNNKEIFRKYQKFIPYTSGFENNNQIRVGLITQASRQTPWTGPQKDKWGDPNTYPLSPTGELNIEVWKQAQFLKNSRLQLESWHTDIFGNQYGLYKDIQNQSLVRRKNILGELWVRTSHQNVKSAQMSLSRVFDTYKNTSLLNSLTGIGIKRIDMFFDTLFIEAQNVLFFEKINYDYDNNQIFSITDDARYISLALPISLNINREFRNFINSRTVFAKAGETWFSPDKKIVTVSTISLSSFAVLPELYQLDLVNNTLLKVFPTRNADINDLKTLESLKLTQVDEPCLSYNSLVNEFLFTFTGTDSNNNKHIVVVTIENFTDPYLKSVQIFSPALTLNPPVINDELIIQAKLNTPFNIRFNAENPPVTYFPVVKPRWLRLSNSGRFTGTPTISGTYYATFKVSNNNGSTFYPLLINVTP
jgi:hypothetical protein